MTTMSSEYGYQPDGPEWPRYQNVMLSTTVKALKIQEVNVDAASQVWMVATSDIFAEIRVDPEFVLEHRPQPGGYYVVFDDGAESWMLAGSFESSYTLMT